VAEYAALVYTSEFSPVSRAVHWQSPGAADRVAELRMTVPPDKVIHGTDL
jgi:hypothetical protein